MYKYSFIWSVTPFPFPKFTKTLEGSYLLSALALIIVHNWIIYQSSCQALSILFFFLYLFFYMFIILLIFLMFTPVFISYQHQRPVLYENWMPWHSSHKSTIYILLSKRSFFSLKYYLDYKLDSVHHIKIDKQIQLSQPDYSRT